MIDQFFHSYLVAFHVAFILMAGCVGLLLVYLMVGGRWGLAAKPVLRAGSSTAPWFFLLFLPVLFGIHHIYPWSHADHLESLHHKAFYFKPWFFALRSFFYIAYLTWIGHLARGLMDRWTPDLPHVYYQKPGALGTLGFVLVMSGVATDWVMSLDPHWFSTIFGALIIVGSGLSALALTVISLAWIAPSLGKTIELPEKVSHDLGNLMLGFTMLWTYMSLSQFIIIWSANLPEEATWYAMRNNGGWRFFTISLFICQFALPFLLLLARERKRQLTRLVRVAAFVMVMRMVEACWLILPTIQKGEFSIHWTVPVALVIVVGLWFTIYRNAFRKELGV